MIEKITDTEIQKASLAGVANRPGQRSGFGNAGMTPSELKERFSALAMLAIYKLNELIEALGSEEAESALLSALYTHLDDTSDDQKRMTLADWIRKADAFLLDVTGAKDGLTVYTKGGRLVLGAPLAGPQGETPTIHFVNSTIRLGVLEPVENPGSYMTNPKTGDIAITSEYDLYQLTVTEVDGYPMISAELKGNIRGEYKLTEADKQEIANMVLEQL